MERICTILGQSLRQSRKASHSCTPIRRLSLYPSRLKFRDVPTPVAERLFMCSHMIFPVCCQKIPSYFLSLSTSYPLSVARLGYACSYISKSPLQCTSNASHRNTRQLFSARGTYMFVEKKIIPSSISIVPIMNIFIHLDELTVVSPFCTWPGSQRISKFAATTQK